ncbi:MAG: hypothetical protein AAB821_03070 [Patescibacteria group bacterium]
MTWLAFGPLYFYWHYTKGARDFFVVWKNLLWFEYHFFSIPVMFQTLFVPFRRMAESYPKLLDIEEFFSAFVVNILMRLVGAVIRLGIIIVGASLWLILLLVGVLAFIAWFILPVILVFMFVSGIYHLF